MGVCLWRRAHIRRTEKNGYNVWSTDLIDRGYGGVKDFFSFNAQLKDKIDIITNPPYKYAQEFVEHAMELVQEGCKVAMLLKIQFLEGKSRNELFKTYPPEKVYVFSQRVNCAKKRRV